MLIFIRTKLVPLQQSDQLCFTQMTWDAEFKLVHSLHPTLAHVHCNSHNLINGIALLAKMCESSWKGFPTWLLKRTPLPNPPGPSSHQPASGVDIFTSGWRTFLEESHGNFNIPHAKETDKLLHYFALNVTKNHNYNSNRGSGDNRSAKCANGTELKVNILFSIKMMLLPLSQQSPKIDTSLLKWYCYF